MVYSLVAKGVGLLILLGFSTILVFTATGTIPFQYGALPMIRAFIKTGDGGRTNGDGVIFDGEYDEFGSNFELGSRRFKDNADTDTISRMRRYASEKVAGYKFANGESFPLDVRELKVDGMSHFSCSVCVSDVDYDTMIGVISQRLRSSIPSDVYESLKESILLKNVTYEGSFQNCTKPLQESGRASNFIGWWNVKFSPNKNTYSACVVVSGVDITMADIIVDYKIKKETVQVSEEPCHCGFFRCERCPVFKTMETKAPIFKKHSITLQQHDDLKDYMMYKSLELIRGLTYESNLSLVEKAENINLADCAT